MKDHITLIALVIAVLALGAVGIILLRYRRTLREKDRNIVDGIRKRDRIEAELERTRIEKETLEKALREKLDSSESRTGKGI